MNENFEQWRVSDSVYQYLVHLFDTPTTKRELEYLQHSNLYKTDAQHYGSPACELHLIVDPEIYKKYQNDLDGFHDRIQEKYSKFTNEIVKDVSAYPNLKAFRVLKNDYKPVVTPWGEINNGQSHLLELLRVAKNEIDFQNIGNASRTLLQKLSNIVFNPKIHTARDKSIDLSEGKFKNRLHTYIKCELIESKYEKLSEYAIAVIDTAETCVDLANKLTHDLNADSMLAESCVIGTITTINIIKLIHGQK